MLSYGERLRAIKAAREFSSMELLILLAINDFAGSDGSCFPSAVAIADWCRCGLKTVYRFFAKLTDAGLLQRKPRYNEFGKRQQTDAIVIDWARLDQFGAASRKSSTPLLDAAESPEKPPAPTGLKDQGARSLSPVGAVIESVSPHTPLYVLERPKNDPLTHGQGEGISSPPPSETKSPPGRVCAMLIDRFFDQLHGSPPAIRGKTTPELQLAGKIVDEVGIDAAFAMLERVVAAVRRDFPALKHFHASGRFWDKEIARRKIAVERAKVAAAVATSAKAAAKLHEANGENYRENVRLWSEQFDSLPPTDRDLWLNRAAAASPAIRDTPMQRIYAAQLYACSEKAVSP